MTTPGIVPAVPMGVGASVSGTTVTVTWTDASTNETGFDIGQETYNSKTKTWSAIAMVGTAAANATSYVRWKRYQSRQK